MAQLLRAQDRSTARWARIIAALIGVALVGTGYSMGAAGSTSPVTRPTSTTASSATFDGRVAISRTRTIHLTCQGTGSPTVVLIAGGVNSGAIWSMPYDPSHPTPTIFPEVSRFSRVCAYDRPNTASPAPDGGIALGTSTPVVGPVTAANGVIDLHRLLQAAKVPGPYVLVAHSFGGLIARLYSSTYPKEVAGLVLIDSPSEYFFDRLSVAQQEMWIAANTGEAAFPGAESFNFPATFAEMRAARPAPHVPTVLFTSDEPFDYSAAIAAGTLPSAYQAFGPLSFRAHVAGQRDLAKKLDAKLILDTHSGHYIFVVHPALVIKSIRQVVAEARSQS
jgi:pimeloyl-ACP methyl ester carboxylesterase